MNDLLYLFKFYNSNMSKPHNDQKYEDVEQDIDKVFSDRSKEELDIH